MRDRKGRTTVWILKELLERVDGVAGKKRERARILEEWIREKLEEVENEKDGRGRNVRVAGL